MTDEDPPIHGSVIRCESPLALAPAQPEFPSFVVPAGNTTPVLAIANQQGKVVITISGKGIVLDPEVPLDELAELFVKRVNEFMGGHIKREITP